jgi:hypothetical protein
LRITIEEDKPKVAETIRIKCKENKMNTQDLYSREKVNKIHIANILRNAKDRVLLHNMMQDGKLQDAIKERKYRLTFAFAVLIIVFGSLLLAIAMSS